MNKEQHTIKRYRTTVSVMLMAAVTVFADALFLYVLFSADVLWWHWLLFGFAIAFGVYAAVSWLLHFGDKIVVSEKSLLLTRAERKKHGKWEAVRNVALPWYTIKGFNSATENVFEFWPETLGIRHWIEIPVRDGVTYRVSPDLYDTFRLKKKLQRYWEQYRK